MVKITQERSSGYSTLEATRPYAASGSSGAPESRLSYSIASPCAGLPFSTKAFRLSKVWLAPVPRKVIVPPLGASGFTKSKWLKSAGYFRSPKVEMPWEVMTFCS